MNKNVQRGVGVVLYVNGIAVAGQENAVLQRSMSPINITNKIDGDWKESIAGTKEWSINCGGTYVKNAKGLSQLEEAFMNNQQIEIKVILDDYSYVGSALITDFPLSAVFNSQFKYSIRLLGSGELRLQNEDIRD